MSEAVLSANLTVFYGGSSFQYLYWAILGARKGRRLIFRPTHTDTISATFGRRMTTMEEVGRVIFSY